MRILNNARATRNTLLRKGYHCPAMTGIPAVLTIAGSDPGGGAGIQADLKTFSALGVYGMAAITALTAQNTLEVRGIHEAPPDFVALQIDTICADIKPAAVKTGMLASARIVATVAERAWHHGFRNLVVDPVMVAKSGDRLLSPDAVKALRDRLIPIAHVVIPNIPEAEDLTGRKIRSTGDMRAAARAIHEMGAKNVVVKGGHLPGSDPVVDLLFDGRRFHEYSGPRIDTRNTHGTGCTFASAIAANLAKGDAVPEAVRKAKEYLTGAIQNAYLVGHGHGPVNHFWRLWGQEPQ
jgi:hydroxymethylpyrimidine/phosphomethylpyrimidine kinase